MKGIADARVVIDDEQSRSVSAVSSLQTTLPLLRPAY